MRNIGFIFNNKKFFITVYFITVLFLIPQTTAYPITGNIVKTEKTTISAGITPDSWLYFFDVALDNINLLLTFDKTEKAKKGLDIARERLMEIKEMIDKNKSESAQTARKEHMNVLNIVQNSVKEIEKINSTEEIEELIEIEKELEEHKTEIEEIIGELKIKMEIKGNITSEQQEFINSILSGLERKVGEVEIEIENEKNKRKIEIEIETGKSGEEVEDLIKEIENKKGLEDIRKEKALDEIKDAEEEINEMVEKLNNLNISIEENVTYALNLLIQAKESYSKNNYKDAIKLAKQVKNLIENYKEIYEKESEEERKIEVEIEGNQTKVEVEIGKVKAKFILETIDTNEIVSEIAERTGLSLSEIENIIRIEIEGRERTETEIEIEDEIENIIKSEINETEFILNTSDKEEVNYEITKKTNLSEEEIEKNIELEIEEEIEKSKKLETKDSEEYS